MYQLFKMLQFFKQIDRFDGLPNMLCAKCAYRTDAFYSFKLQVQATEKKLRKMFETQIRYNIKVKCLVFILCN